MDSGNNAKPVGEFEGKSGLLGSEVDVEIDAVGSNDQEAMRGDGPMKEGNVLGIKSVLVLDECIDLVRSAADQWLSGVSWVD